jgi:hypothetical protein
LIFNLFCFIGFENSIDWKSPLFQEGSQIIINVILLLFIVLIVEVLLEFIARFIM